MKRWTAVLLLVLSVFTLAPRTSINPGGELVLTSIISRTQMRPGSAVTYVLQARNRTTAPIQDAQVDIAVGWDGHHDAVSLLISRGCTSTKADSGFTVNCRFGALDPGEQRVVRVTARPTVAGQLTFAAIGLSQMGPVPAQDPILVQVGSRS